MAVKPNVENASLRDIKVESSTIGQLDMTLLQELLQKGLEEGREPFNWYIQTKSLNIPSELFGLFKLSDLIIKYHNGYLEGGLTPTFLPIGDISDPYVESSYDYSMYD